jgi:hypothetical protein
MNDQIYQEANVIQGLLPSVLISGNFIPSRFHKKKKKPWQTDAVQINGE